MAKNYNTRTASLKATIADIRNLDAKQIKLNGNPIVGNVYDLRGENTSEYDIWPNGVKTDENGNVTVYPLGYNKLSVEEYETIKNKFIVDGSIPQDSLLYLAKSIKNNKVLDEAGNILFYFDTNALENTRDENSSTRVYLPFYYLESFESDLDNLINGTNLFLTLRYIKSFKPNNLNKLKNATSMFQLKNSNLPDDGYGIVDFDIDLPELEIGKQMFQYHTTLKSFKSNTPLLIDALNMFRYCSALTSFASDLPSLTIGQSMFEQCSALTSFASDLPSLTTGYRMFQYCSALTSFSSDLSSLTNGYLMFNGCKLDAPSVANIVHSLPTHETGGQIPIGIGCDDTEADQLIFAQECDCDTWQELLDEFSTKNWTVEFQCNGRPTEATTYNLRRGETLPIYTKLEEVTESEHYTYTSQDGSKFYNINYFHSTNGSTEGYDVFSSLEEAISTYNVTPKN